MSRDNGTRLAVRPWIRRFVWGVRIAAGILVLLVVLSIGIAWCTMADMPGKSHRGELPPADGALRALADELRRDVEHLASEIGERNVLNRPAALARAAEFLESEFAKAGYKPARQEYRVGKVSCSNLDAKIAGSSRAHEIVVVGAHYDSVVGTPGANDNGSGVAAMLALARRFAKRSTPRTLRFAAFVNEEPPYFQTEQMGSRVYARRCRERKENVVAMMSLETIGYYSDAPGSQKYPPPLGLLYPSEGNFIAFVSNPQSAGLLRQVVGAFRENEQFPSEGGSFPEILPGVGLSDQWSFWQEGYPAVMVTDTAMFRYPHYHEPEDTIDKIDFDRLARVVRGLEKVVEVLTTSHE